MATLGLRYGTEPEQFRESKLILAWAANIHGTNIHLWPFIVEARRKGAKLYTIDPVRTRTAALSDKHFTIFPGSDLALALGLAHVIIGENLYDADYVAKYTNGFEELRRACRGIRSGTGGGADGHRQGRYRSIGARVRDNQASRNPGELWRAEVGARRGGGEDDCGAAGFDGIVARGGGRVAAFDSAGVPVRQGSAGDAGAANEIEPGARGQDREHVRIG